MVEDLLAIIEQGQRWIYVEDRRRHHAVVQQLEVIVLGALLPHLGEGWHQKWFYLSDITRSFPAYSPNHLGLVVPPSWKSILKGLALKLAEGLLDWVTALKDAGLTSRMVLRVFLLCPSSKGEASPNVGVHRAGGPIRVG